MRKFLNALLYLQKNVHLALVFGFKEIVLFIQIEFTKQKLSIQFKSTP
jgi:hypothetical protein